MITEVLSGIDTAPLASQVRAHPELWDIDKSWTAGKQASAIYNVSNIVLRWNKTPPGRVSGEGWDKPAFDLLHAARPIVEAIYVLSQATLLGKVLITRLQSGQSIAPHVHLSPPGVPRIYHTFQIPLSVAPGCMFGCGADEIYMEPGRAYWFENTVRHWVVNGSPVERLSMLMDVRLPLSQIPAGHPR